MISIPPSSWEVMISSRMRNYEAERKLAQQAITRHGMIASIAEDPLPKYVSAKSPYELCRRMAEDCDIFLLLLGPTYGFKPDGQETGSEKSATHLEFNWARARNPGKILIFIERDAYTTTDSQQQAFIQEATHFSKGKVALFFSTLTELENLINKQLRDWQQQYNQDLTKYLESVRDNYRFSTNAVVQTEMATASAIKLQLRTEEITYVERQGMGDGSYKSATIDQVTAPHLPFELMKGGQRHPRQFALAEEDKDVEQASDTQTASNPTITTFHEPTIAAADDLLRKLKQFILIGDPGMGKTSLLRYLTFSQSQAALDVTFPLQDPNIRIPFYVTTSELGGYIDRQVPDLFTAMKMALSNQGYSEADNVFSLSIQRGIASIFIDGLDEVSVVEARNAIITSIKQADLRENEVILSARPSAYVENPLAWKICEIEQLNDALQTALIQRTFIEVGGAFSPDLIAACKAAISQRLDLQIWAGNPLLLTLMAKQFAQNRSLPSERARIYSFALTQLVDIRHGIQGGQSHNLEPDRLRTMLATLALQMMRKRRIIVTKDDISDLLSRPGSQLSQDIIAEFLQRASIVETRTTSPQTTYAFLHLTFQEYLAATSLVQGDPNEAKQLLVQHSLDPWWEEVSRLYISELHRKAFALDHQQPSHPHFLNQAYDLINALITADHKRIPLLKGADPTHLTLARAYSCYQTCTSENEQVERLRQKLDRRWWSYWTRARAWSDNTQELILQLGGNAMGLSLPRRLKQSQRMPPALLISTIGAYSFFTLFLVYICVALLTYFVDFAFQIVAKIIKGIFDVIGVVFSGAKALGDQILQNSHLFDHRVNTIQNTWLFPYLLILAVLSALFGWIYLFTFEKPLERTIISLIEQLDIEQAATIRMALNDSRDDVKKSGLRAVQKLGSRGAPLVEDLISMLDDHKNDMRDEENLKEDSSVNEVVVQTLAALGPSAAAAVPALVRYGQRYHLLSTTQVKRVRVKKSGVYKYTTDYRGYYYRNVDVKVKGGQHPSRNTLRALEIIGPADLDESLPLLIRELPFYKDDVASVIAKLGALAITRALEQTKSEEKKAGSYAILKNYLEKMQVASREEKNHASSEPLSTQESSASDDVLFDVRFNYIQDQPSVQALPRLRKIVEDYNAKVVSYLTLLGLIALGVIFLIPIFIDQWAVLLPWQQFHSVFPFLSQTIFAQLRDKANFGWFLLYTLLGIIILSGTWAARDSFNKFRNSLRKRAATLLQTRLMAEEQRRM